MYILHNFVILVQRKIIFVCSRETHGPIIQITCKLNFIIAKTYSIFVYAAPFICSRKHQTGSHCHVPRGISSTLKRTFEKHCTGARQQHGDKVLQAACKVHTWADQEVMSHTRKYRMFECIQALKMAALWDIAPCSLVEVD